MNTNFTNIDNINISRTNNGVSFNSGATSPCVDIRQTNELASKSVAQAMRASALGGISYASVSRLQKLQKAFQDVFMNKNLSIGETKVMADRYRDLNKIKDKNDYIKAVFEEAKRNFGFEKTNISLEILNPDKMPNAYGHSDNAFLSIAINSNIPRSHVINTIHHEFRHMKQNQIAYSYSPEKYMEAINKKCAIISNGKAPHAWSDLNKFTQWIDENLGGVRAEYVDEDFANKVLAGISAYTDSSTDYDSYWNSFIEQDARKAGSLIEYALKYF